MDGNRDLGVIMLAIGMVVLIAANLFLPWGDTILVGPDETYKVTDKIYMFIALLIMYLVLVLVFISYNGPDKNYICGLYVTIVIITLLMSFSYNIAYGVLLLLTIMLLFILILITRLTKKYYLIIPIILIFTALIAQRGLYL